MTTATLNIETVRVDPLRTLTLKEVAERTGISARTIHRWLAEDIADGTPGQRFPRPLNKGSSKLLFRELAVLRWMERQEVSGE